MIEKKKRGPKNRFPARLEIHIKFSQETIDFINSQKAGSYQAYFDRLMAREMGKSNEN